MAGLTVAEAFRMSLEELMKHSSSQEFYTDKNGVPHMALNFSDDDVPANVMADIMKDMMETMNNK